jgi:enterochelin esterase-like enzyme
MGPQPSRLRVHAGFHSEFLPGDRDVTVYLPADYDDHPDRDYPVLCMQDGQNLFHAENAFVTGRTWRLGESTDAAIYADEVEPLILVGIASAVERRLAEYTPTRDWKMGGGEADKYGRMLTEELLPFLAANYRVKPGAANTGLGGSSLGALATLYLGLKYADTFGRLAVLSPSVWWNHRVILSLVSEAAPRVKAKPRIWLDIGDAEGARAVADTDLLERRLRSRGWRPGIDLSYRQIPGAMHDEAAWAERVRPMLQFLFPAGTAESL